MTPFLLWLLAIELVGLAAWPLAGVGLARLPDRGYGLTKVAGLLLVTYLNYLFGTLVHAANNVPLLVAGIVALCAAGLWVVRTAWVDLHAWLVEHRTTIAIEEGLFLILFVAWTLFRAAHPGILSTEKPMDLALMTATHRATAFPPYDPWMAGTTINYYYGGYLAVGTLVTLTGVPAAVGYNLGVALLFALVGSAAYSVGLSLTHSQPWAFLGTALVLLVGNLDGVQQLLDPTRHGASGFDFFHSSRVVEPVQCHPLPSPCTITEFPAFSYLLGDLHPHMIALAFTILAIAVALSLARAGDVSWVALAPTWPCRVVTVAFAALSSGALYFMNSWDWPTYTLLIAVALILPGLARGAANGLARGVALAAGVAALSYILYLPFHLDFKPQYSSFGLRLHGSPIGDVLTMFGLFLAPIAVFVCALAGRPAEEAETEAVSSPASAPAPPTPPRAAARGEQPARPVASSAVLLAEDDPEGDGASDLPRLPLPSLSRVQSPVGIGVVLLASALVCALLLGGGLGLGTVGLLLPLLGAALYLALLEARAGEPTRAFALLLCAGGVALIILCDVLYLRDNFCGPNTSGGCSGDLYRMNTVFKFYYQAWTLLALGACYGLYSLWSLLRGHWRLVAPLGAAAVVASGGVYLVLGLFTPSVNAYTVPVAGMAATLDGSAYLDRYTGPPAAIGAAIPADAATIRYLNRTATRGHPTILEAEQVVDAAGHPTGPQDYWPYPGFNYPLTPQELMMARISTFTGLPTILGWGYSHEGLWHGDAAVATRYADLQTLYTSADRAAVARLLRTYDVGYIYLGQVERYVYYGNNMERYRAAVRRFEGFGAVVYNRGGVIIVRTPSAA